MLDGPIILIIIVWSTRAFEIYETMFEREFLFVRLDEVKLDNFYVINAEKLAC